MRLTQVIQQQFPNPRSLFTLSLIVLLQILSTANIAVAAEPSQAPITVGLSMHFMRDDYAIQLTAAVESTMSAYRDTETIVTDANADAAKQLADMENLVVRGVSAIIVVPIDEKAILPAIRQASQRNIPVVAITRIPGAKVLATVGGSGDYANGLASGELLVEATGGTGKVAMIGIPYSLWRIDERERGFQDALEGSALEIVSRQSGLDQARVQDLVAGILVAHPDLAGIWCTFSNQVVGAADALRVAGRNDIVLTGIDADKAIIERIRSGWVTGTAAQFPSIQGQLAAQALIDHFDGREVAPEYEVPVALVTAENLDEMAQRIWGE